ncbi:MAG: lipoate--protein ligase family protein [Thermoplasmata archaeon]|nr:MAG: lipoate--protein ligase family protein [Thermoplasmata archaeon]
MTSEFPRGEWRLIDSGTTDPAYTMAVDEAILLSRVRKDNNGNAPEATLHLYSRDPPAISLGYFQKVDDEVHIELCKQLGIQILRRGSGGGAIYTDSKQLIYGLVIPGQNLGTIQNSFSMISQGIIETLKLFGLIGELKGLNDVVIGDKKISGCAQTRKGNIILQHGTFMMELDASKISQILTPSTTKFRDKVSTDVCSRLTCLANILGYTPSHKDVKNKLIQGFENAFNVKITIGTLTEQENVLVEELLERKYHNQQWNFKR